MAGTKEVKFYKDYSREEDEAALKRCMTDITYFHKLHAKYLMPASLELARLCWRDAENIKYRLAHWNYQLLVANVPDGLQFIRDHDTLRR